jgi:hypothetical protein
MAELSREEFLTHIAYVRGDVEEVKQHLLALNGRTRTAESKIAVLENQVVAASQVGADKTARSTGIAGLLAAAGSILAQWWFKP